MPVPVHKNSPFSGPGPRKPLNLASPPGPSPSVDPPIVIIISPGLTVIQAGSW